MPRRRRRSTPRTLAVLCAALLWAAAGSAAGQERDTYEDPQGRFTVPIPTNWSAETVDGAVRFTPPEGDLAVHLMVVEDEDLEGALAEAWERVDESFDAEVEQRQEPPAQGDVETVLIHSYDVGPGRLAQAVAQLQGGLAHVLLVRGDLAAVQQRASQINVIQSGWTLAGEEETDLSGHEPASLRGERLETFVAYVRDALERFDAPGASVVVAQNGEVVYQGGFGVRDRESGEPVTPSTLMMTGSVTKTFTTMMMAGLVDEGVMDWDTPVREVLPEFEVADPELTETITMENLVCACTGVPRRDYELIFNAEDLTAEGVVGSLADFEFFTDFGEAFQYSNQLVAAGGYAAARAAVQAQDGADEGLYEPYVRVMQRRLLEPLGMDDATFSFQEARDHADRATPYGVDAGFEQRPLPLSAERFVEPLAPAGALWADAEELGHYLITLLQDGVAPDGERIVSEEQLHHTWEPQVPVSADADYGLGWMVEQWNGLRVLSHGGNTLGFTADLAILPDADVGVAVLTNRASANALAQAVRLRLFELLFEQPAEADESLQFSHEQQVQQLQQLQAELEAAADRETVAPFLGRYTNDALGDMRLAFADGHLTLDAGAFVSEVRPRLNDEGEVEAYVLTDSPLPGVPMRLERGDDGEPRIRFGEGAVEYVFEPTGSGD